MASSRLVRAAGAVVAVVLAIVVARALLPGNPARAVSAGDAAAPGGTSGAPLLAGPRAGEAPAGAEASSAAEGGVPVDLGALMQQVHFAFRRDADGRWRGEHDTFTAVRTADGVLEVTPYHQPRAAGPGERRAPLVEGRPVRFAPSQLRRGWAELAVDAGDARGGEHGELEIARGVVVEELRNGPGGVEQSWRFDAAPPGRGDLEVRIPIASGRLAAATDAGLHLTGGLLGVRYGHARWIDAAGVDTDVPSRWEDGAIVLRVPSGVLERSAWPAVLDPTIGPEQATGTPVNSAPARGNQARPRIAWNRSAVTPTGTGAYLAVWEDDRFDAEVPARGLDILGARITAAGEVLDPTGIPISARDGDERAPAVASNAGFAGALGDSWMVVWEDSRSGVSGIYGTPVSATGAVVVPAGIAIIQDPDGETAPAIASNGWEYLVVWEDPIFGDSTVYGNRLNNGGYGYIANGSRLSWGAGDEVAPSVVWNGTDYLVVWQDHRTPVTSGWDIYGARVTSTLGTLDSSADLAIATGAGDEAAPAVASDGTNAVVVYAGPGDATHGQVWARTVRSSDGHVSPAATSLVPAGAGQGHPAVVWTGASYLAAWEDYRVSATAPQLHGARVDAAAALVDPSPFPISTTSVSQAGVALASDRSGRGLAVWVDGSGSDADLWGAPLAEGGAGVDPVVATSTFLASPGANRQTAPAVASGASGYLLAWVDSRDRGSGPDVYGARLNPDGSPRDPAGIALCRAPGSQDHPTVAWDGADGVYLVVWEDLRSGSSFDVHGALLRESDAAIVGAADGFPISTAADSQRYPVASRHGAGFLVAWQDQRSAAATGTDVYAARVSATGTVAEPGGIPMATGAAAESSPAVAWNGSHGLVVWEDGRNATGDVYGALVAPDGSHGTPFAVASSTTYDERRPAITSDGTDFWVVWEEVSAANERDLGGGRVTDAGALRDGATGRIISSAYFAGSNQSAPAIGWNGAHLLVVWNDDRNGVNGLLGARLSTSFMIPAADASFFQIAAVTSSTDVPRLAALAPDFLVAYVRTPTGASEPRTFVRRVVGNRAPVVTNATVTLKEDPAAPVAIDLASHARDPDGDAPLTWTLVAGQAHGTLANLTFGAPTYLPDPSFNGTVTLTVAASDGLASTNATLTIGVTSVLDPPIADPISITTDEDHPVAMTLHAADADGDPLTYTTVTSPGHGQLSGTPPDLTYTPDPDWSGTDAFTYRAWDGTSFSTATVSLTYLAVNDRPDAISAGYTMTTGTTQTFSLGGHDVETPAASLAFAILTQPAHGALDLTGAPNGPSYAYTAAAGFVGADSFTFTVSDGQLVSAPGTITLTVLGQGGATATAAATAPTKTDSAFGCSSGGHVAGLLPLALAALALPRLRRRRAGATLAALALAAIPAAGRAASAAALPPASGKAPASLYDVPLPPPPVFRPAPRPAPAAAPKKPARLRVAVMPVKAGLGLDAGMAALVTDALVAELTDRGLVAITSKDVQAALGYEREKQLLGCAEDGCLAQIAGALGADRVVFGDLAQIQGLTIFSAQVFNTRAGSVEHRFHERMSGAEAEDLLDATERAAAELFPGAARTGSASRRRTILTSTQAHPLALVLRGGADVQQPGGFGTVMLEYRLGRSLRVGLGPTGAGTTAAGADLRVAWAPVALDHLSIYAALDGLLLFPGDLVAGGAVALGVEWAFTERLALALEAPYVFLASAPARYKTSYFMPGLAASWRF